MKKGLRVGCPTEYTRCILPVQLANATFSEYAEYSLFLAIPISPSFLLSPAKILLHFKAQSTCLYSNGKVLLRLLRLPAICSPCLSRSSLQIPYNSFSYQLMIPLMARTNSFPITSFQILIIADAQ